MARASGGKVVGGRQQAAIGDLQGPGDVTLHRAKVLVRPTAPGMFVTQ